MSNPNPANMIFSTRYKYYLNYRMATGSVSVSGTSHAANTATNYSVTIPIDRTKDFSNIKFNISSLGGQWFSFPSRDIILDANFTLSIVGSYGSNNLTLKVFVVNQSGGVATNTTFTFSVAPALFVTPT